MLATKKSVDATPEVSLRNPLHTVTKHVSEGTHSGFEFPAQMPPDVRNRGNSGSQKGLISPENENS